MTTVWRRVKLVPDNDLNADGQWVEMDVPASLFDVFAWTPLPGYHVVAYAVTRSDAWPQAGTDLQDGGPMHAAFLGGVR